MKVKTLKKENKKPTAPKEKQEERKHYRAVATVPENNSSTRKIETERENRRDSGTLAHSSRNYNRSVEDSER